MDAPFRRTLVTPIGTLGLEATEDALVAVIWAPEVPARFAEHGAGSSPLLDRAAAELGRYFRGETVRFTVPLSPAPSPFQQAVREALLDVPFGEVRSYGWLAARIGRPKAARAVGAALGANPLPIIVPCHRIVASDGSLGGFGGGLDTKRTLLAHERRVAEAGKENP
jgi:methylated-DNA-[protein]-cysteine S-methyltransferase